MSELVIRKTKIDEDIIGLLNEHLKEMHKYSPAESIHALDTSALSDPAMTFWSARIDGQLAGCGALKALSPKSGEIKSMKTSQAFVRRGVAKQILVEVLAEASARDYVELSLETGTNEAFAPAVSLYEQFGFEECGPFGDYKEDPFSRFYSKSLVGAIT